MIKREEIKKMWIADNGDGTYSNPILYTDYSDPDAIRVGEDYFLVASSFCNTPAVPVLHSKDLVNWKVISYAMEKLPFPYYDKPVHGCGTWAPSIRYHEGSFYVFIPMPDEGIFMVKSSNPFEGWEEPVCVRKVTGWIDPCPFWDDDGKAYMVSAFARSRIGFKSILHMSPIEPDCTGVLGDGRHVFDGSETQPTIEGPKLYKRNGYYYIFAPAGGVKPGWQTVLRSRSIWGPYEEKIVMHQGSSPVNGPHQGAWVDTPSGEDWFLHFQDVGNAGRIVHLQPMHWEDDWPVIGVNEDENGCGEPVMQYKKPDVGKTFPVCTPEDSDFFEGSSLGLQWQWNANYKREWYDLKDNMLTLYAQTVEKGTQTCDVSNLLLQKWPAPEFAVTVKLHVEDMAEGDVCGMVSLGGVYTDFAVKLENGEKKLVQRTGEWTKNNETEEICGELAENTVYLRMYVEEEKWVSFAYSTDGEHFIKAGKKTEATPGRWVGVKAGLFAINEEAGETGEGGLIRAEYFVYQALKDAEK
ncbi:MAG: glycoside hydrolase 43 family protein [Lachnospiraceae bacterium]|nr:glycoside hydrolase 43 family protein [Lachnospiraceae bacterium]